MPRPSPLLVIILLVVGSAFVSAQTTEDKNAANTELIKATVAKVGTGLNARVKLRLWDGTKTQGLINEIGPDGFALISTDDVSIGITRKIAYSDVAKINGKGASGDSKLNMSKPSTSQVASSIVSIFWSVCSFPF
jgi:hypothetical protein